MAFVTVQVVIQPITYDSHCRSVTQQMMAALAVANRHEEVWTNRQLWTMMEGSDTNNDGSEVKTNDSNEDVFPILS